MKNRQLAIMAISAKQLRAAKSDTHWWPDLYLKKGRRLVQIQPEQCAAVREIYNAGRGASEIRHDMMLHDSNGVEIGFVSYNGRVWLNDIDGKVEIPVGGRKTAAQREAEGWR